MRLVAIDPAVRPFLDAIPAANPTLIAFAGSADTEAPNARFGRIRSTITAAGQIQLGARVRF